jgi:uncharacterized RDD family membrane protein YckC
MKNIEIITTQNVVLQYELASLKDRIFAFVLDMICLTIVFSIFSAMIAGFFVYSETARTVGLLMLAVSLAFYSLFFELFYQGRSIGKMALKIQVIKLNGSSLTLSDLAARWVFRLIDIHFSIGGVAALLIMSSSRAQRIGDIIANTVVVKMMPTMNVDLQNLLSIYRTEKYIPQYQEAKKLKEEDALLIKTTLERYRRFYNDTHRESVYELAVQVKEILGIENIQEEKTVFLQTVLQDYVILSR